MNVPEMAALARDHWKKTDPELYQNLVKAGDLEKGSEAAAKLTLAEMKALMRIKIPEQEAWQESRHLFIFRTKEQLREDFPDHAPED